MFMGIYDPEATCPKCQHDKISALHKSDTHKCRVGSPCKNRENWPEEIDCCHFEHIDRTCRRCKYTWPELPVDTSMKY